MQSSNPRVAVVTGSTGGIGEQVARLLAADGWNLVLVNRSDEKSHAQRSALEADHPGIEVDVVVADFMDIAGIERAADVIADRHPTVDALYNIAGVLTATHRSSAQGHESHFAVNALAPYLMIRRLRPLMKRDAGSQPAMIINISSGVVHQKRSLDVGSLPDRQDVDGFGGAYADSKVVLDTISVAMADDLAADGILIRSVDPGATRTRMIDAGDGVPLIARLLKRVAFKDPAERAVHIVAAASPAAFDGRSGIYVAQGKVKANAKPATDPTVQHEVLDLLERLQAA